jgi:probable rRNA maturation factor
MSVTPNRAKPELSLAVQYAAADAGLPQRAQLRRWVRAALAKQAAITLRFVDEAEGRKLNRDFRQKDYATNVLTFVYGEQGRPKRLEGDIVICAPVLAREARERRLALAAHCAHLVVHGVLHLQGWDHQREDEAHRMEAREAVVLARFGIGNPYAAEGGEKKIQ